MLFIQSVKPFLFYVTHHFLGFLDLMVKFLEQILCRSDDLVKSLPVLDILLQSICGKTGAMEEWSTLDVPGVCVS